MYTYHTKLHTFTKGYMYMYAMISVKRQSTGAEVRLIHGMAVHTPNKLAMILKLEQAFSYTLKMRSPRGMFSQIQVIVGD